MIEGDSDMVRVLLENGADPKKKAVFWNYGYCCTWSAVDSSFQHELMVNGNELLAESALKPNASTK